MSRTNLYRRGSYPVCLRGIGGCPLNCKIHMSNNHIHLVNIDSGHPEIYMEGHAFSSARLLFFSRKRRQCIVYSIFDGSDFFNSVEFVYSPGSFTEQGLYSLAIFKRRYMTSTEQRLFYGCITVVTDFMTNAVVLTVYQDTVIFTARVYSPVPLGKLFEIFLFRNLPLYLELVTPYALLFEISIFITLVCLNLQSARRCAAAREYVANEPAQRRGCSREVEGAFYHSNIQHTSVEYAVTS